MNVAILSKRFSNEICDIINNVIFEVSKHNCDIIMISESSKYFSGSKIVFFNNLDDLIKKSDMIFVVGGDGTLIHYAKEAARFDKNVMGINGGNLGFLCGCEKNEINKIADVLNGKYKLVDAMMLEIDINGKKLSALNDIVLRRDINSPVLKYSIFRGADILCSYEADGLIFATPTGSTAYSFSAGGSIVESGIECVVLTPICPHNFFSRSIILKPDEEIEVSIQSSSNKSCEFYISVDGNVCKFDLNNLSNVKIKKSKYSAKIINLIDKNFYNNIKKKLGSII